MSASMQWISIEDILADSDLSIENLGIDLVEPEAELRSDTIDPEYPIVEVGADVSECLDQDKIADLERLAEMVCDRISQLLEIEQERNGLPKGVGLLSRAADTIPSGASKSDAFAKLAQQMIDQLHQHLEIEQERQGFIQGCLPW